uniref:Uncharacterized protein n=1 Tax=Nelumbo nucifera TaxID=4432 RepID=A0A822YFX5_NELNU|nr:TPA_asm: hypothetical protein HUJ06_010311 [Nelumbo nucifera]
MDVWVVAVAACSGYLAKYWKNLSKEKEGPSQSSSGDSLCLKSESQPLLQQLREQTSNFRRLSQTQSGEDSSSGREEFSSNLDLRFSDTLRSCSSSATEMASTSGYNGSTHFGEYDDYSVLSTSSLSSGISNENHEKNGSGFKGNNEVGDSSGNFLSSEFSTAEMNISNRYSRSRSLKSRRPLGYSVKPISSLESCLIAQLYKEHVEMEEYVFSSLSSPRTPAVRPFLVTDGSRIISRASGDYTMQSESLGSKLYGKSEVHSEEKTAFGVSPLPEIDSVQLPRKVKQKRGKGRTGRYSSSNLKVSLRSSRSEVLLFCIGIAVGVMTTLVANKREVDKLKDLLKQTENLVQDLQEELEMKDSLTVKELTNEGYESQEINDICFLNQAPAPFPSEHKWDASTKCYSKEPHDQKANKSSESMSKIEAELEAELERLEVNMNSSSSQRRLSDFLELDPDFVGEIIHGELKAELINGGAGYQVDSDRDASGTSTQTQNANYAVSPRELSLRLQEVIQARLEERIMELETALQQSQTRVHLMESEQINFRRDFSNSEIGSSSNQESPTMAEESNNVAHPLVLNLSGEALDAYNEAYEELMRVTEPEEDMSSTASKNNKMDQDALNPFGKSPYWSQNEGGEYGSISHFGVIEERWSRNSVHNKVTTWEERISRNRGSNEVGESEDEEDEMGKLLIKRIVEKARQGSPVVLNARKMLFSMDEN